jgi:hypothetical protein
MSFSSWLKQFEATTVGRYTLSFVRAFVGVLVPGLIALALNLNATHNLDAAKVALFALVGGAVAAGIRVVQSMWGNAPGAPPPVA